MHPDQSAVSSDRAQSTDDDHRVVPFRPRASAGAGAHGWFSRRGDATSSVPPVEDLAKYEGGERDDDYRHRMMVNLAALIFTLLLATAGAWLAVKVADMRKTQDCFLSGRRNCTPIDVHAIER
jgi:hypothetical protein